MRAVADYWAARPDALMATWWGKGADIPAIKRATERTGVAFDLSTISHFDLCYWAIGHLRLPIRGLSLKDVASYFGLSEAAHGISAGDEAVDIYLRARADRSKAHRNRAHAMLEAYNADDLASLAKLIETLLAMYPQDEYIPPEPKPTRERRSTKELRRSLTITTVPADDDDFDPRAWMDDDDPSAF